MPEAPITSVGTITQILSEQSFRARMINGKELVVHLPKAKADLRPQIVENVQVRLEFTPYDFEKARIAALAS